MKRLVLILLCLGLLSAAAVFAETIHLKTGKTIEGEVLEKTDEYIRVNVFDVPMTIFLDEIEGTEQLSLEAEPAAAENVENVEEPFVQAEPEATKEAENVEEPSVQAEPAAAEKVEGRENPPPQPEPAEAKAEPAEENLYVNKKHGFSITGPRGWIMQHRGNSTRKESFEPMEESPQGSPEPQAAGSAAKKYLVDFGKPGIGQEGEFAHIFVMVQYLSKDEGEGVLQNYIEEDMAKLKEEMLPDFEIIEGPQELEVNGNKMSLVRIKGTYNRGQLRDYENLNYYFLKDGKVYIIIFSSTPASDFPEYDRYFQETIDSIRFE